MASIGLRYESIRGGEGDTHSHTQIHKFELVENERNANYLMRLNGWALTGSNRRPTD